MKAIVQSVSLNQRVGEFTTIDLRLIVAEPITLGEAPTPEVFDLTTFCNALQPGTVITEFGVGDASTKETKITLPVGRKLCLD